MVIEFLASHQLEGINLYITPSDDNLSGKYVSLSDYKALEDEFGKDYKQCAEYMLKLEALLKRWNEIAPELTVSQFITTPELSQLIQDTSEAIK